MISKLVPLIIEYLYDNNKGLFRLACPADAVLTDELGRRIGTLNGVVINEIPGARNYLQQEKLKFMKSR